MNIAFWLWIALVVFWLGQVSIKNGQKKKTDKYSLKSEFVVAVIQIAWIIFMIYGGDLI